MASQQDFNKRYNLAFVAYGQGKYEEASTILDCLESDYPDNPQICLLQAHLKFITEQYPLAHQIYERVIFLAPGSSQAEELINCAQEGIERTQEFLLHCTGASLENSHVETSKAVDPFEQEAEPTHFNPDLSSEPFAESSVEEGSLAENGAHWNSNPGDFDWLSPAFLEEDDSGEPTLGQRNAQKNILLENFFEQSLDSGESTLGWSNSLDETSPDTFALSPSEQDAFDPSLDNGESTLGWSNPQDETSPDTFALSPISEGTFLGSPEFLESSFRISPEDDFPSPSTDLGNDVDKKEVCRATLSEMNGNNGNIAVIVDKSVDSIPVSPLSLPSINNSFFEALDRISFAEFSERSSTPTDSQFLSLPEEDRNTRGDLPIAPDLNPPILPAVDSILPLETTRSWVVPGVEVKQGAFAWFQNAALNRKKWYLAASAGAGSALAVLVAGGLLTILAPKTVPTVSVHSSKIAPLNGNPGKAKPPAPASIPSGEASASASGLGGILLIALTSGLAGFGACLFLSHLALNQSKRSIQELMEQFDAIRLGNFNVRATVFSGDELGALNADFNNLSMTLLNQVQNALQRAEEMEKARDNLQRQVIRLLDNVEGAARGDLTLEAEVTADVLGTVADAFNLTIKNLRDIVSQVKKAAQQVNKGSTESELFARKNSSDAKGMAEEVAVTLNSIHLMSESVQRVAENAKEAEEVAISSSKTALKGGEAVERTVAGILQIRETVSETARKVKRLAEASQEISKIVALISQIASRTNLLALNASIQAARAGEAGRGFAVVAGEVRQLADRSAKSLKEIEQIVLQIQGETGSVMTAMEEGIQQVIDVTDKSEQAKRSLEDIIAVSNHINTLVRSISSDTVKQQETSLAVAQVMQWVDVTAQGTAQESQQVAGSLQNLVAISHELLSSVERFRVDKKGVK